MSNVHDIDRRAARRSFSAASNSYDQAAILQKEVRQLLLDRLAVLKLTPHVVVDLGCGTGHASAALQRMYPKASVLAVDAAWGMLAHANQQRSRWQRWFGGGFQRVCADAFALPLKTASVDVLFSNLMLQWCLPPDAALTEMRRVLKPNGVLLFSSFGPDTLKELRAAWIAADAAHTHVNSFVDMHDLGDAMVRAGLAEPVLDVERFTLTYPDVKILMRDLKAIGAHNVTAGRSHALTGRGAFKRMQQAYEQERRDGVLPASYEVVLGQGWGNDKPANNHEAEVRIPIDRIGRRRP